MALQQKDRLAAVSPRSFLLCVTQRVLLDFFFLRQPSRPNVPRPVAKRGNAAGKGVPAGVAAEPTTLSRPWLNSSVSPGMLNSDRGRCADRATPRPIAWLILR